jgi:hypothetical protein
MKLSDLIAGSIGLFFSVLIYWAILSCPNYAISMAGPRFFPQLLAIVLGGLSIFLAIQAIFKKNEIASDNVEHQETKTKKKFIAFKVPFSMFGSVAYIYTMKKLGFLISTFLFFIFLMFIMQEKKKIIKAVSWAIGVTAAAYIIFAVLLKASLPIGTLFR